MTIRLLSHGISRLTFAAAFLYSGLAVADGPNGTSLPLTDDNGFTFLSDAPNVTRWAIGGGVGVKEEPYKQYGRKILPLPVFLFDDKWVRLTGPNIDLKVAKWNGLLFSIRAKYDFGNVYSGSDSAALAGMHNRKGGFWVGPAADWRTPYGTLSADFLNGANKGQQAHLRFGEPLDFGDFSVEPHVGVEWLSKDYVNYYYGVTSSEVIPGRNEYTGKATENFSIGTRVAYKIDDAQTVSVDLGVTRLGSSIYGSPIVGRRYTPQIGIAYMYRFQ